jgi:transposase-like protein
MGRPKKETKPEPPRHRCPLPVEALNKPPLLESGGKEANINYLIKIWKFGSDAAERYVRENLPPDGHVSSWRKEEESEDAELLQIAETFGFNIQKTARHLSVKRETVKKVLSESGQDLASRRKRKREEKKRETIEMRMRGFGIKAIAGTLKLSHGQVIAWLKELEEEELGRA